MTIEEQYQALEELMGTEKVTYQVANPNMVEKIKMCLPTGASHLEIAQKLGCSHIYVRKVASENPGYKNHIAARLDAVVNNINYYKGRV